MVNCLRYKKKEVINYLKKMLRIYDFPIFFTTIALCLFGLIMVYSSSMISAVARYDFPVDYFYQKQKSALIIGFFGMLVAMIFPYKAYQGKDFLMWITGGTVALLILTFIIGHTAGNAQSWIKIGTRVIQPGEFSKLTIIIYLAAIFGKRQNRINQIDKAVFPPLILLMAICFLIAMQPDYGTALIILMIASSIIICSGMSLKSLSKLFSLLIVSVIIMFFLVIISGNIQSILSEERVSRFTSLIEPFETQEDAGYQLANSLIAIGAGGLSGQGLGQSFQKYGYLPESHTDFILAIIAEELGVFGVSFVLGGLSFIVLRSYILAARCKDPFGSLLIIGISSMIGIQVFINAGGVVGLIPITGITLPFISYGGSSLLLLMVSVGILQNVVMRSNISADRKK